MTGAGAPGGDVVPRQPIVVGGHLRIRPFNTADSYPEQRLDNDLCQAVVAGSTIYLRGQVAQDLDTGESVHAGNPAAQAEQVMTQQQLQSLSLSGSGRSMSPRSGGRYSRYAQNPNAQLQQQRETSERIERSLTEIERRELCGNNGLIGRFTV